MDNIAEDIDLQQIQEIATDMKSVWNIVYSPVQTWFPTDIGCTFKQRISFR